MFGKMLKDAKSESQNKRYFEEEYISIYDDLKRSKPNEQDYSNIDNQDDSNNRSLILKQADTSHLNITKSELDKLIQEQVDKKLKEQRNYSNVMNIPPEYEISDNRLYIRKPNNTFELRIEALSYIDSVDAQYDFWNQYYKLVHIHLRKITDCVGDVFLNSGRTHNIKIYTYKKNTLLCPNFNISIDEVVDNKFESAYKRSSFQLSKLSSVMMILNKIYNKWIFTTEIQNNNVGIYMNKNTEYVPQINQTNKRINKY